MPPARAQALLGTGCPDKRQDQNMSKRQPGQGRYAHPEHERRLLLANEPAGVTDPVEIVDRYIDGTRLTRMVHPSWTLRTATSAFQWIGRSPG